MFVLLTTLFLALGKIVCEVQVSREVNLPSPFLLGSTTLPGYLHQTTSPKTLQISQETGNHSSATTRQASRNQQKIKLFATRYQSRKMDQRRPFASTMTTIDTDSTSAQNNTSNSTQMSTKSSRDNYDKVVIKDKQGVFRDTNFSKQSARNSSALDYSSPLDSVTAVPPPVNVTVVDRGAFDGDACPTGYVRVNGVCVMPD